MFRTKFVTLIQEIQYLMTIYI